MDNYAVVEFLRDSSVSVIPSKWILKDGAQVCCIQLMINITMTTLTMTTL